MLLSLILIVHSITITRKKKINFDFQKIYFLDYGSEDKLLIEISSTLVMLLVRPLLLPL